MTKTLHDLNSRLIRLEHKNHNVSGVARKGAVESSELDRCKPYGAIRATHASHSTPMDQGSEHARPATSHAMFPQSPDVSRQ